LARDRRIMLVIAIMLHNFSPSLKLGYLLSLETKPMQIMS